MNPQASRTVGLVLAASALTGFGAVVAPQHLASLVLVTSASVVAIVGLGLLAVAVSLDHHDRPTGDLDRIPGHAAPPLEPAGLRDARRDLARPATAGQVPPALWDRLATAALVRFHRQGIDVASTATRAQARRLVDPATWALLTARTVPTDRPLLRSVTLALDELDRLVAEPGERSP